MLRAILGWVSSQIFGFFSFSVLLGINFVLETNSLVILNPKNDRIVFQPGIHLLAETAEICQYGRYFFRYEIGGLFVLVYWPVRYGIDFLDTKSLPCLPKLLATTGRTKNFKTS